MTRILSVWHQPDLISSWQWIMDEILFLAYASLLPETQRKGQRKEREGDNEKVGVNTLFSLKIDCQKRKHYLSLLLSFSSFLTSSFEFLLTKRRERLRNIFKYICNVIGKASSLDWKERMISRLQLKFACQLINSKF